MAAIAYDPFTLTPGTYQLGGSTYNMNLSVALGGRGDQGQVKFEAFDSRYVGGGLTGDNIIYGTPLWSLLIASNGTALADKSNISVQFTLNDAAAAAGVLALSTPDGGTMPIDVPAFEQAMDTTVKSALTVKGGVASLSNFDPFPSNLVYNVSSGSVTYANDAGAGLTAALGRPRTLDSRAGRHRHRGPLRHPHPEAATHPVPVRGRNPRPGDLAFIRACPGDGRSVPAVPRE